MGSFQAPGGGGPGIGWKSPGHRMVLRPHCCCRCPLGCCLAPPTQGEPVPARCGHAPPWPALLHGPMYEQAPAPRNMAVPRAIVLSPGTDEAALNPASLDGPAGPCRGGRQSEQVAHVHVLTHTHTCAYHDTYMTYTHNTYYMHTHIKNNMTHQYMLIHNTHSYNTHNSTKAQYTYDT